MADANNNLFFDIDANPIFETVEVLNESGDKERKYKISGVFSTIGKKNRNGRVYPRPIWEREVRKYQKVIENGEIESLMEYEHPARSSVDQMLAVGRITKLYIEGDYVMGEAFLLNNDKANQLKSLIDNGIKISVSSRGTGTTKNGTVTDFNLVTYDIVAKPSDFNATMNGVFESYQLNEGIVTDLQDPQASDAACDYIISNIEKLLG